MFANYTSLDNMSEILGVSHLYLLSISSSSADRAS